jgi:hypothetical protein
MATPDPDAPRREAPGERVGRLRHDAAPPSRPPRNYMLALIIALIVFALLFGVRILWGGLGERHGLLGGLQTEETPPEAPAPSN